MSVRPSTYISPVYLHPGAEIEVLLADSPDSVSATVLRHMPFSIYQVIVCQLTSKTRSQACHLQPGARFILKIFDPRYIPRFCVDAPQWSYGSEKEAYPRHQGQLTKWCFGPRPQSAGVDNWEEFYFLKCKTSQMCEVECYRHLAPLQGSAVPFFYGYGKLDLSAIDPTRSVHPPVILIELIENAAQLNEVDARVLDPTLVESFVGAVARMGPELGVTNNDLNPGNYLFSPMHKPDRILLIDWSHAGIREPQDTEEEWEDNLKNNGALRWTKQVLAEKFLHAGLPVPPSCADWKVIWV